MLYWYFYIIPRNWNGVGGQNPFSRKARMDEIYSIECHYDISNFPQIRVIHTCGGKSVHCEFEV